MRKFPAIVCVSFLVLAPGPLYAADKPDPNIDPVLPDPEPNNAYFPPGTATSGTADPGPALRHLPISARQHICEAILPAKWFGHRGSPHVWREKLEKVDGYLDRVRRLRSIRNDRQTPDCEYEVGATCWPLALA